ncbi:MAG TPA: hypothetical protein VHB01_08875 [Nitrosospira sp.]|nr:hypothetical protein [Nitrosospira sp.]
MKAFITTGGVLNVVPENETEEYALIQWKMQASIRVDDAEREEDLYFRGSRISIPDDIQFR